MRTDAPWTLLRAGNTNVGLEQIRTRYAKEPTPSHIMELGVAYLWSRHYKSAWEHFRAINEQYPQDTSSFYGMAGVAKWCLGEFHEAVEQWQAGLLARFTDTGGLGITLPLLLFTASVLKPHILERRLIEEILNEKYKDPRIKSWPGPVASWILGHINDKELHDQARWNDASVTRDRLWLFGFYRAVQEYSEGTNTIFKKTMRKLADTSAPEWSNEDSFLARIWNEEFFLSRYEAD